MNIKITKRQKEIIETEAVAFASINPDGSPNLIAVGDLRVVSPNQVVITDNFMKQTFENIKKDFRVCLATWTKNWEEGYKFIGKAEYYDDGKWVEFVKNLEANKGYPAKGAILITIDNIFKLG